MPFSTRKAALAAAAAFGILALAACGGGGGGGGTPQTSRVTLPEGHSVVSGSFTVAAGRSVDRGGVRFSCAAGGAACAVTADGGSGAVRVTGGRLTVARVPAAAPTPQPASVTLPQGHSVAAGSFTVAAGKSVDRGGVRFSCAAGGAACAVTADVESGTARFTGGRLTVARVPAAAPTPQPASVTLPQGHSVAAGSFTVAAGRSVDRGGVRFSCAAGGAACAVTADAESGAVRVTGGRLTVARVPAATPTPQPGDGGQDGGMEETDWPFPAWPIADITSGGGTLSWTPSQIYNHIRRIEDHRGRISGDFASADINSAVWCTGEFSDETYCDVQYRPVMTHLHGGIPIVQARALDSSDSGVDGRPGEEIGAGGILNHGYFMVAWQREYIGRDYEDEEIKAVTRETWTSGLTLDQLTDDPTTGRWRGALIGTGESATSPLHRQFIVGDVDVTVRSRDPNGRHVNVAFSNIRNLSTGDRNVALSHTRWDLEAFTKRSSVPFSSGTTPGYLAIRFLGPNDEEVLGVFQTEEAVGGFGAKKQ